MRRARWVLRILVLLLVAASAGVVWIYQHLTDPAMVRAKVLGKLAERFPGAEIELGEAELQIFGGVRLRNLRLTLKSVEREAWSEAREASSDERGAKSKEQTANAKKPAPFAIFPEVILQHDKRRLAKGQLVIRKIEIRNPTLTIVRRANGSFNLTGVYVPAPGAEPTPIIDVQQATVVLVDEGTDQRAEIRDVSLSVLPGEKDRLKVQAAGNADLVGSFNISGSVNPQTGEITLSGALPEFPIDAELIRRAAAYFPEAGASAEMVRGTASLKAELAYHPSAAKPLSYAVHLHLTNGWMKHPDLAFPLENAELVAHCDGGRAVLERLTGTAGGAAIHASGELDGLTLGADFRLRVRMDRFPVTRELYDESSSQLQELCRQFMPEGNFSLDAEITRCKGELGYRYTLSPENASIVFEDFPYPLKKVSGTLAYTEDRGDPRMRVNLSAEASGQPVRVVGEVFGEGLRPGVDLKPGFQLTVTASDVPIDQTAFDALKIYPETHRALSEFHLTGKVNVRVESSRPAGRPHVPPPPSSHRLAITLRDGAIKYDRFPYPLEEVHGTVEIRLPEETWSFKEMRGKHNGGLFAAAGAGRPTAEGDHVRIAIRGVNVLLDDEMEFALGPKMKEAWDLFLPEGRVDVVARVEIIGKDADPDVDLELTARGLKMKPPCFPYALTDVTGTFRYAKDVVRLDRFEAKHGKCKITLGEAAEGPGAGGRVIVRPGGGFRAELRQLRAEPLTVDEDFLAALPRKVRSVFAELQPDQPIRLVTDLMIDDPGRDARGTPRPTLYEWDGHVAFLKSKVTCGIELKDVSGLVALRGRHDGKNLTALGNLQLEEATLANLPFQDIRGKLEIVDDVVTLKGLVAHLHGGEAYGKIVADFEPELVYTIDLTASKLDLAKYARKGLGRRGQVQGLAYGRLALTGKGGDPASLRGRGEFSVADGKLYDLPLILELLSFLSGYIPNGTAFSEIDARFAIAGDKVSFSQITLSGDALTLRGEGTAKTDGTDLNLDMYGLIWGRAMPLLPPVIDAIPPAISKQLMRIKIQGSLDKVKPKIEPVPALVEPVKELLQLLSRRQREKE